MMDQPTDSPPSRSPQTAFYLLVLLAAVVYVAHMLRFGFVHDDAYILFRYAAHIAGGAGYVFNPGEFVYGASAPLYTLVLAGVATLLSSADLLIAARVVSVGAIMTSSILLYRFLPLQEEGRLVAATLVLFYPRFIYSAMDAMEAPLILLGMVLSMAAIVRNRPVLLGAACGALLLLKVDTAVWVSGVAACLWFRSRAALLPMLLTTLILIAPWLLYSQLVFGSFLPHTMTAKFAAYINRSPLDPLDAFRVIAPEGLSDKPVALLAFGGVILAVVVSAFLTVGKERRWEFLPVVVYVAIYWMILFTVRVKTGAVWTWWTIPLWGCVMMLAGVVAERVLHWKRWSTSLRGYAVAGAFALAIALTASSFTYFSQRYGPPRAIQDVAHWLRESAEADASVMLEPIGYIGFVSGLFVHDFVGLVSPDVTRARIASGYSDRWFVAYLRDTRPTYVVLRSREVAENRFVFAGYGDGIFAGEEREWFEENYRRQFFSTDTDDPWQLTVWKLREMSSENLPSP